MYRLMLLLILLGPALAFPADKIFKSVDDQGNVTYSAQPPAAGVNSEQVDVPSPPSEEAQRHAEEQAQKVKDQAKELEKDRKSREAEQAAAAAAATPPTSTTVIVPVPVPSVIGDPLLAPRPVRPMPPGPGPGRPMPKR